MDELIEATGDWMNDEHAVDFVSFLENFYATHPLPPAPEAHEMEGEFEFELDIDDNMTEAEFWSYVNG